MRGIFWNSRGLKDLAKRRFLADASLEHHLDFIALSETGRANFSPQFLNTLSGGIDFDWHCLPPRGRSGGILLGVRCDSLEVRSVVMGDFAVKFRVRSKTDGFNWALVAVYGAAQPELKPDFLADMVRICGSEQLSILVGVILISSGGVMRRIMTILTADGRSCLIQSLKALTCVR